LVRSNFEANIFDLLDSIASKNSRKSIRLLNKFLDSGENEMYIFAMILKQFRNIAIAKFEPNLTKERLAQKAQIHPYVAQKSLAQAKSFDKQEIISIYRKFIKADFELKSENNPRQTLLGLII
jgi:DNA polymerase III delta subunit